MTSVGFGVLSSQIKTLKATIKKSCREVRYLIKITLKSLTHPVKSDI